MSSLKTNYRELSSDLDTPVALYAKIKNKFDDAFLFESIIGGEQLARYSLIGFRALDIIKTYANDTSNPYELLSQKLAANYQKSDLDFFHIGYVGIFSFESIRRFEPSLKPQNSSSPECYLMLPGSLIVIDNATQKLYLVDNYNDSVDESDKRLSNVEAIISSAIELERIDTSRENITDDLNGFTSNTGKESFLDIVDLCKKHIHEGDVFQIVPSHKLRKNIQVDPLKVYRRLRTINPSPYMFIFNFEQTTLVGASPESLVKSIWEQDALKAFVKPIAGTYKRGKTFAEDAELIEKLSNDPKEIAEHVMLIDLARNDLGRVAQAGTVKIEEKMSIEKYSHVMHIVSTVSAKLKPEADPVQLLQACFPAGTLSGAPKIEAVRILSELEKEPRDYYGGCIGCFAFDKSINTAITIRTLVIEPDRVTIQAGAGIVADSQPELEWQETINKASALISALDLPQNRP